MLLRYVDIRPVVVNHHLKVVDELLLEKKDDRWADELLIKMRDLDYFNKVYRKTRHPWQTAGNILMRLLTSTHQRLHILPGCTNCTSERVRVGDCEAEGNQRFSINTH